jgi:drug/metabolite transporter (DMT)-like permease
MGTPLGDIGALISVNSAFAALLGRMFLQESVYARHFVAIILSIGGATLISKPGFLFGSEDNSSFVGSLCALGSGISMACIFVVSRKAAKISTMMLCISASLQNGLGFMFLPDIFVFISDEPWANVSAKPMEFIGWMSAILTITLVNAAFACTGYKYCPAALSAAVDTAMKMVSGYVMDIIIFNTQPDTFTLVGGLLMLGSVVIATVFNP